MLTARPQRLSLSLFLRTGEEMGAEEREREGECQVALVAAGRREGNTGAPSDLLSLPLRVRPYQYQPRFLMPLALTTGVLPLP